MVNLVCLVNLNEVVFFLNVVNVFGWDLGDCLVFLGMMFG